MKALFYIKHLGKLHKMHDEEVPDNAVEVFVHGKLFPTDIGDVLDHPVQAVLNFKRLKGTEMDNEVMFLFDADKEIQK